MASQVRLVRLTWENEVSFKMDTKLGDESYITILEMDENGHLSKLWDAGVRAVCVKYFEEVLDIIGTEMKG